LGNFLSVVKSICCLLTLVASWHLSSPLEIIILEKEK